MWVRAAGLLVAAVVVVMVGCSGDYERQLPNGYWLIRSNAYTISIGPPRNGTDPRYDHASYDGPGVPVAAYIEEYEVSGQFVIGRTRASPQSELAQYASVGYFILDSVSGSTKTGMDRNEFEALAKSKGISERVFKRVK